MPLINLATSFNKKSIDESGNTFWQNDLVIIVTVNKKPLKGKTTSQFFIALCSSKIVILPSNITNLTLSITTELSQSGKFSCCL